METDILITTRNNDPHLDVLYELFPLVECGLTAKVKNAKGETKVFRHNKGTWSEVKYVKIVKSKKMK